MLYSAPATGVTVIIAAVLQVAGCRLAVGANGMAGEGSTITWIGADSHPAAFLIVTL